MHWTAGHPYLTQRLCLAVVQDDRSSAVKHVDAMCDDIFLSAHAESDPRATQESQAELFESYKTYGDVLFEKRDFDKARLQYLRAFALASNRAKNDPKNPAIQSRL